MVLIVYNNKKMKQSSVHNLTWFPIFLISLKSIVLGLIWFFHPEPWLLDKEPNEALLQSTFKVLFSLEANSFLPIYLKVLYRFFALWLVTIGLLIFFYVMITRLGTFYSRISIYFVLIITLFGLYYLVFNFLPLSPFIPLLYGLTILLCSSIYFSMQLKE